METIKLNTNISELTELLSELENIVEKINNFEIKIYSADPIGQELIAQQ